MIQLKRLDQTHSLDEKEAFIKDVTFPDSFVYLQTCNRVELYYGDGSINQDIIAHLFGVTAGLKSSLIGENQIQGQVKSAYQVAIKNGHISKGLHWLFQNALKVGKKVRTKTSISSGAMTYSSGAFACIKEYLRQEQPVKLLVVGINAITIELLKYLSKYYPGMVCLANRTLEKSKRVAQDHGCQAVSLDEGIAIASEMDAVVTCTSSSTHLFSNHDFSQIKHQLLIDLSVPRNINPVCADRPNLTLFNISDIEMHVMKNYEKREEEWKKAHGIIQQELVRCVRSGRVI